MTVECDTIGRVVSVTGYKVIVMLDIAQSGAQLSVDRRIQKGTLVKIRCADFAVFGMVTAVTVPMPGSEGGDQLALAELTMLGEIELGDVSSEAAVFRRGISLFPTVGDTVLPATQDDLGIVYARPSASSIRLGTIHQDRAIPAFISPDNLLGKHFAILGTTGTGKSSAVALLLRRLLESLDHAHILLLDPHNEYARAFADRAELIDSTNLQLPLWLFSLEEIGSFFLGTEYNPENTAVEMTLLRDGITRAKQGYSTQGDRSAINADTPVPYRVGDVVKLLKEDMGRLGRHEAAPYLRLISRIETMEADSTYGFMFGGISIYDNFAKILSRLFRIPVDGKPMTILDLSAVPSDILNIVVSVICRLAFEFALFSDGMVPVLLVCEEAHRYAPQHSNAGFEPTKRMLSRIAKEGRKYGISLGMVSQRPTDLAISALSQCNTIFALRLSSQADQEYIRGVMPDCGEYLLDLLPSLRNAEAIVVGEGISVPARVQFDRLPEEHLPRSQTAAFSKAWREDVDAEWLLQDVIVRWRAAR